MEEFVPRIPGYEVLGELGRGGMGIVYKAHSLRYDCPVALKMILSGRGANRLELARFGVEAMAVGSLQHPNIVRIHEVGVHHGFPYFILEYAPGGSLAGRLASGPVSDRWAVEVSRSLALAMWHVHQRRIIHRDLKPANILLMADDVPKITDFGLAKFSVAGDADYDHPRDVTVAIPSVFSRLTRLKHAYESDEAKGGARAKSSFDRHVVYAGWDQTLSAPGPDDGWRPDETTPFVREAVHRTAGETPEASHSSDRLTSPGSILGTLRYMAPEQVVALGGQVGPPADIHALGAILYEMLTGRPPFSGRTMLEALEAVVHRAPLPPRTLRDTIDPDLEAVCLRCLEKKPEHRYENTLALADDLQRILDGKRLMGRVGPLNVQSPNEPTATRIPAGTTRSALSGRQGRGPTRSWVGGGLASLLRSMLTIFPTDRPRPKADPDDPPT